MVLHRLRAATRSLHEIIESRLDVLNPHLGRSRYLCLLQRFYGFYEPIEASIPAYGPQPIAWLDGDRRKLSLLVADLGALGISAAAIARLPRCRELPDLRGLPEQLGCMYVLEGATLGGRVVLKHIRPALGLNGVGAAFFSSYHEQVGAMWRAFCGRIEQADANDGASEAIVQSAVSTFEALNDWLCGGGL